MWRNTRRGKRSVQSTSSTKSLSVRSLLGIKRTYLPGFSKKGSFNKIIRLLTAGGQGGSDQAKQLLSLNKAVKIGTF